MATNMWRIFHGEINIFLHIQQTQVYIFPKRISACWSSRCAFCIIEKETYLCKKQCEDESFVKNIRSVIGFIPEVDSAQDRWR